MKNKRFFALGLLTLTAVSSFALAESVKPSVRKTQTATTITTTTIDVAEGEDWPTESTPSPTPTQENEISETFGSTSTTGMAGCKTQELAKQEIKNLKAECKEWLKDQKAGLKNRYSTGVCEESCSDCSMGLRRCSVKGTARYRP